MNRMTLDDLVRVSRHYGKNTEFVVAGGGNTSYKTEDTLFIKASGAALSDISADGFVRLGRGSLSEIWERSYPGDPDDREAAVLQDLLASREKGDEDKRPSVEALLHDQLEAPLVVHTHPPLVNGLTCSVRGQADSNTLFGSTVLWVPVSSPGYLLAVGLRESIAEYRKANVREPDIIFLQNHGLVVSGTDSDEVINKTDGLMRRIGEKVAGRPDFFPIQDRQDRAVLIAPALRMLLRAGEGTSVVKFITSAEILKRTEDRESFSTLSVPLIPDHLVYCGSAPLFISLRDGIDAQYDEIESALRNYKAEYSVPPRIIAVENLGVFAWGPTKKEADVSLEMFEDVIRVAYYASFFGGVLPLPDDQIRFLSGWEVERLRRRALTGEAGKKRLGEKIVLVTGGAQGIGGGIADAFASERANVAVADINLEAAEEKAGKLTKLFGRGKSLAVRTDVSDENSIRQMVDRAVLEYGGLDVMISNAGIVRAGSLEELDLASFESVTRINYTAFYLCARHASRIFKIQARFDHDYMVDIIQINSKSGLEGSSKNFCYSGSKFGGIGLVQSFALELVENNIKVNAVCPGNYLDGPLWSDPENGLFVQYLKAGKVSGAKTVSDVRRYYEARVPMGRGCTVEDIFRAVVYLIEQNYETGQALPVTGGQVMLK